MFQEDVAVSLIVALAISLAPNSADSRLAAVRTSLARLCSTWSDHAPDRAGDAERADHFAGEIIDRNRDAADFRIEFAVVEGDRAAADFGDIAQQYLMGP